MLLSCFAHQEAGWQSMPLNQYQTTEQQNWKRPFSSSSRSQKSLDVLIGAFSSLQSALCKVPGLFQRPMQQVYSGQQGQYLLLYLGDNKSFSSTVEQRLERLEVMHNPI